MVHQAVVLTNSLLIVAQYYRKPRLAMEQYLQILGTRHHDRGIPRDLYQSWTDAMLDTLKDFHGESWSDDLASQWREAIGRTVEIMFEGYEKHFTV